MKKILVPIDFSEASLNAAYFACRIAQKNQSVIIFVHAYRKPVDYFNIKQFVIDGVSFEQEHNARKYFKKIILDKLNIKEKLPIMKFDITHGFAIDVILEKIKHYQVEMVVMGTKGASKILDRMWGSITSNVIKETQVPVLAIPENAQYNDFKKIVYATDLNEKDVVTLNRVKSFADMFHAKLELLHIETDYSAKKIIEEEIAADYFQNEFLMPLAFNIVENESVVHGIEDFIDQNDFDLLVMLTLPKNFFVQLTKGSLVKKISLKTKTPILVYH